MRQRLSGLSSIHRTPAGLPLGMPGIGDEIDSAIQQAPQPILQSTLFLLQTLSIFYLPFFNRLLFSISPSSPRLLSCTYFYKEARRMGQAKQAQHHLFCWVRSVVENTYLPHLPFISATSSLSIPRFLQYLSFDRLSCVILSGLSSRCFKRISIPCFFSSIVSTAYIFPQMITDRNSCAHSFMIYPRSSIIVAHTLGFSLINSYFKPFNLLWKYKAFFSSS